MYVVDTLRTRCIPMSNPYREIFRAPGAKGFSAAGFFARLPIAMAPIGIVAMLSQTHGEYWLAGAVSATFALTNAALSPQISRLVDRKGQSWTEIFRDRPELNTAFAFESAADELVYISGASLSVGLAVSLFPEAGMMISTTFLALGTFAFLLQRATEPKVRPVESGRRQRSAIFLRPVQIITLALIFVGSTFATAEVSAVAITKALGQPEAASLVIGVYAIGSFVVGLILGALNPKMPLQRQLLIAVSVLALTALPLLVANTSVALLAFAVFLSGVAISPIFITSFGLIERRVPESMLTEGVTWVMTGIGIGMALGAFVSGWVIDNFGPDNGFWVSVAASLSTVAIIALGQRSLSGDRGRTDMEAVAQPAE